MKAPYNASTHLTKEWSELNTLINEHYYLKKKGAQLVIDTKANKAVIIFTEYQIQPLLIDSNKIELFSNIISTNKGPSILDALTYNIPTAKLFVEAGGKMHRENNPYRVTFSGETKEIWTIGGMFRGKADSTDARRISWYHLKPVV